jgi:hypothetical protein
MILYQFFVWGSTTNGETLKFKKYQAPPFFHLSETACKIFKSSTSFFCKMGEAQFEGFSYLEEFKMVPKRNSIMVLKQGFF